MISYDLPIQKIEDSFSDEDILNEATRLIKSIVELNANLWTTLREFMVIQNTPQWNDLHGLIELLF